MPESSTPKPHRNLKWTQSINREPTPFMQAQAMRLYEFILSYARQNGYVPTYREIWAHLPEQNSDKTVRCMRILTKMGLIEHKHYRKHYRLVRDDPWRKLERVQRYARALAYAHGCAPAQKDAALQEVKKAFAALHPGDLD